uniref:uncharacterized protein LOC122785577 isoform X1 n=1 Tax=Solea senegalensis TaxID=28829 RepID=UPI001CD83CFF|nr:uncharacterized protein LOC122785577 isoform X1 [Solea senegalensis]
MDLVELADMGRGCEDKNCGLSSGFPEHCSNQDCQWEEPMFGLIELVCVTVIYIPLMLFGLLGNILTILVVWLRPHMRSSTYLYLSSMAVSDLLILLLLPLDLYKLWRPRPWLLGDIACKLTMFLSECCTFCTILHITFLSLERYVAVCWPIAAKTLVTRRRTRALIGCLWLGAAVSAAPVLIMVGVEEVGGEEVAFGGWREDAGWTGREGEKGAFVIGGGERGNGHLRLMGGGPEGIQWDEKETIGLGEREKLFKEEGERKLEILETDDRKQGDGGEREDGNQVDTRGGEEEGGKMEDDRMQQNKMKEDEGGGKEEEEEDVVEGGEWDMRECRCTHYAVSSGLLSAMMILSNLYFLVPLCILGLVYGLIGRTLWLRPQSSRKDQSHRHTVKMLGVIVLAFVLCWLPFHVGRTIFSLSLGSGTERQETYMDTNSQSDVNTLPDSRASSDTHPRSLSQTGQMTTHAHAEKGHVSCDRPGVKVDAHTDVDADTEAHTDNMSAREHLHSLVISHTRVHHKNAASAHHSDPDMETHTHANCQLHNGTNTTIHDAQKGCVNSQNDTDPHNNTHDDTQLYFLYYLSQYFNLVSSVLYYLSAAVNPLLYNLMSARYRHAVHSLIHTHCHAQSHRIRKTLDAQTSTTAL